MMINLATLKTNTFSIFFYGIYPSIGLQYDVTMMQKRNIFHSCKVSFKKPYLYYRFILNKTFCKII